MYTPGKEVEEMQNQIAMMESKYMDLCNAYKELAIRSGITETNVSTDSSNMKYRKTMEE
jgi:hypothetical protein